MAPNALDGRVALVTGSSSGIGAATARALAAAGATVVINSWTSVEAGEALAAELGRASYVRGDIADAVQARSLIEQAVARHGRLDILVNNAGATAAIPHFDLAAVTADTWRHLFEVNVIGTWQVIVAAVPYLRRGGEGSIVNVSSLAGHRAAGSSIPYAVSKAALSHLTVLLANVLGPAIRVNAVAPGFVETPRAVGADELRAFIQAQAPLRRAGLPEDIAEVILALIGARYVTGEIVMIDGGLHLR